MKKIFTFLLLLTSLAGFSQSTTLVISQVYGGGGNSGAPYKADYVELHNISATAQSTAGLSVQYGASGVAGTWTGLFILPSASIPPGGYYLVQMSVEGSNGVSLSSPDAVVPSGIAMAAGSGRVALVNGTAALSACPSAASVIDYVGYGSTTCFEGPTGGTAVISATLAAFRKNNGCLETNNNASDFEVLSPAPRNSSAAAITCGAIPVPSLGFTTLPSFGNTCINTVAGPNSFAINGANLTAADIVVGPLAGYTFSATAGGIYTSSLTITQPGGTFTQPVFVQFAPALAQSYAGNIPVSGGGAASALVPVSGAGIDGSPIVTTGAASSITFNSATLSGSATGTACGTAVTVYGIEYSTINGFPNGTGTAVNGTNISGSNFSVNLSGLTLSTTYYYRAYGTNTDGTRYGSLQSFTTSAAVLTASPLTGFGAVCVNTTAAPNSFTINSAGLGAGNVTVSPLNGFTYSTTSGGTYTPSLSIAQPGGPFTQIVFVKFTAGAVQSYNGNIVVAGGGATSINVFATGSGVNTTATLLTGPADVSATDMVTVSGTISSFGCSNATAYGIEYSGINNFTEGSGIKVAGTPANAAGNFMAGLTKLVPNTVYYYRAFATNAGGTGYGPQQTFTTGALGTGLIVYGVPAKRNNLLRFSVTDIRPDHYAVVLYNSNGQKVLRKDMIIQTDFINDFILIPGQLVPGVYQFRLETNNGFSRKKTIIIR